MSSEDFQIKDSEEIGIPIMERGLKKINHEHGAQKRDENENVIFCFLGKKSYL